MQPTQWKLGTYEQKYPLWWHSFTQWASSFFSGCRRIVWRLHFSDYYDFQLSCNFHKIFILRWTHSVHPYYLSPYVERVFQEREINITSTLWNQLFSNSAFHFHNIPQKVKSFQTYLECLSFIRYLKHILVSSQLRLS